MCCLFNTTVKNQDGSTTEKSKKVLVSYTKSANATDKNALIKNAKWIDITNEEPGELLKAIDNLRVDIATQEKTIDKQKGWVTPQKVYDFLDLGIDNAQMSANYGNDDATGIYGVLNNIIKALKKPGIWNKIKHTSGVANLDAYIVDGTYGGDNFIFNTAIKNSDDFNNKLLHRAQDTANVKIAFLNDAGDGARVYIIEKLADGNWDNNTVWKQTKSDSSGNWASSWVKVSTNLFVNSEADYQLDASLTNVKTPTGIKKLNDAFAASGGLSCRLVHTFTIPATSHIAVFGYEPPSWFNNKLTWIEKENITYNYINTSGLFKFKTLENNANWILSIPFPYKELQFSKEVVLGITGYKIVDYEQSTSRTNATYRIYQCD